MAIVISSICFISPRCDHGQSQTEVNVGLLTGCTAVNTVKRNERVMVYLQRSSYFDKDGDKILSRRGRDPGVQVK